VLLTAIQLSVAFHGGYFILKTTPEIDVLKVGLCRTASSFLALREVLVAEMVEDTLEAVSWKKYGSAGHSRQTVVVSPRCLTATGLLASTNLRVLDLCLLEVRDLTPLAYLVNLTDLRFLENPVRDLAPLATMVNLKRLQLTNTQVDDLTPLASLTKLELLGLRGTQVIDLTPLASLVNLTDLNLWRTQVVNVTPLAKLSKLKELWLGFTQVRDLRPLASLVNLERLNLQDTPADRWPLDHLVYSRDRHHGLVIRLKILG